MHRDVTHALNFILHQLHQEIVRQAIQTRCRCLGSDDYCAFQGEPISKAARCPECRQPGPQHQSWCPQSDLASQVSAIIASANAGSVPT
ncbi:hypothetical protein [Rhodobacter sp. NSM]|uniref:hypothetical protein n=1 Tax=Rhodobacter sp. NSM TaxID=3457501 RepID=UPI003FD23159